ncbi:unnamed protein product [Lactuca saligna]|uniref:Uncharacterized protein n=1 Tax=Lactuca saligna TaxID=75948 RepID=A0AA35ZDK5_LACSI|nr:unnamed protein product [Lactuca saligna]
MGPTSLSLPCPFLIAAKATMDVLPASTTAQPPIAAALLSRFVRAGDEIRPTKEHRSRRIPPLSSRSASQNHPNQPHAPRYHHGSKAIAPLSPSTTCCVASDLLHPLPPFVLSSNQTRK